MKANWTYRLLGFVIVCVVLGAMTMMPNGSVREIHNADSVTNFALVDPRPRTNDWPRWGGSDGRNTASSDQFPTRWTSSEQEGWQVSLPENGHSMPILWENQLFLFMSDPQTQRIALRSYDRATGRANWQTDLHEGSFPVIQDRESHVSSTPACDGQSVFTVAAVNNSLSVSAVGLTGKLLWRCEAGPYRSRRGYLSSPTIFKSLVIVAADQEKGSYVAAIHRQTGSIVWRVRRPDGESSGIPMVAAVAGRSQLILAGKGAVTSYAPATGQLLWSFRWAAERVGNSVTHDGEFVYATNNSSDGEVLCIRADGSGDVTKSGLVWRQTRIGSEIPSPIVHEGLLYVLSDDGRLTCLQSTNGKVEWRKRLQGTYSASPIVARDYLVLSSEVGLTTFVQTGASGIIVAENESPEGIVASPIIAGDAVYLRTLNSLRCILPSAKEPIVERPEPFRRRL